jgi:hypothetical protein
MKCPLLTPHSSLPRRGAFPQLRRRWRALSMDAKGVVGPHALSIHAQGVPPTVTAEMHPPLQPS